MVEFFECVDAECRKREMLDRAPEADTTRLRIFRQAEADEIAVRIADGESIVFKDGTWRGFDGQAFGGGSEEDATA